MNNNKTFNEPKARDLNGLSLTIECLHRKISNSGFNGIYHYHSYLELIFCISGEFNLINFNHAQRLKAGDMVLISPNEPHGICYISETSEHYCIKFEQSAIELPDDSVVLNYHLQAFLSKIDSWYFFSNENIKSSNFNIKEYFRTAILNYPQKHYYQSLIIHSSLLQIMAFIFQSNTQNNTNIKQIKKLSSTIYALDDYIKNNYSTATLMGAAKSVSMNYSYLSRIFHDLFGISFKQQLIKTRINIAMDMLINTNLSVTQIAFEVGFTTTSHFIKTFKEEKGLPPSKFRKSLNENLVQT